MAGHNFRFQNLLGLHLKLNHGLTSIKLAAKVLPPHHPPLLYQ